MVDAGIRHTIDPVRGSYCDESVSQSCGRGQAFRRW